MNKFISGFIAGFMIFGLVGCNSLLNKNEGVLGKSTKSVNQAAETIRSTDAQIAATDAQRLTHIGAWSKGVERSLNHETNPSPAVVTAQKINERVEQLANKPDADELKEIYKIVDALLSNQLEGQKLLNKKDKDIIRLENEIAELNQQKQDSIKDYMSAAEASAAKADQYQTTLKGLQGGWGLNAIWYGIKTLISRIALFLGIFTVLFFVLRMLAVSNPIAGSVFSVFEMAASWAINTIKSIFPKSAAFSKLVPDHIADGYKSTLKHIMDEILLLEHQEDATGKNITLDEVLVNIEKSLNDQDKINVNEIKSELNWKI